MGCFLTSYFIASLREIERKERRTNGYQILLDQEEAKVKEANEVALKRQRQKDWANALDAQVLFNRQRLRFYKNEGINEYLASKDKIEGQPLNVPNTSCYDEISKPIDDHASIWRLSQRVGDASIVPPWTGNLIRQV
ncbi:unnamed protein product [Protopolystoma xenopodis]|uniref:Uncharacterized protein n=1 Tax=Protopolystoma xenopodis TaxID=117903 RepID=A0A448XS96_9PLAT|nr:unnamed protein product [Protopolystoma xenopodis]